METLSALSAGRNSSPGASRINIAESRGSDSKSTMGAFPGFETP
jgi:hypothetical protein